MLVCVIDLIWLGWISCVLKDFIWVLFIWFNILWSHKFEEFNLCISERKCHFRPVLEIFNFEIKYILNLQNKINQKQNKQSFRKHWKHWMCRRKIFWYYRLIGSFKRSNYLTFWLWPFIQLIKIKHDFAILYFFLKWNQYRSVLYYQKKCVYSFSESFCSRPRGCSTNKNITADTTKTTTINETNQYTWK